MEQREFMQGMQQRQETIEAMLRRHLPEEPQYQKTIFDAMEYSLMAGGKRIRPILMQEAFRLFDGKDATVLEAFMTALEMIHTYSLVHDDLPAMDNDMYRRGRKTTHVVYGEDMGILAGDALLNAAFETAADGVCAARDMKSAARALQILSRKAGVYGMVGGQVVDVERTGQPLEKEVLTFIYEKKTGALLEAALMVGACLAGADEAALRQMEEMGRAVGMAFQIQDDILDCTGTMEEIGKPVHSDERNQKTTYVSLYGLAQAHEAVEAYSDQAIRNLKQMPGEHAFLESLITYLIHRKK